MPTIERRHLYLTPGCINILGYGRDVHEPMIHLWNDVLE